MRKQVRAIWVFCRKLSPVFKSLLFVELLCIGIWGPIEVCLALSALLFVLLLAWPRAGTIVANPLFAMAFCLIVVGTAIPFCTSAEVLGVTKGSLRFLLVMLASSAVLGSISMASDFISVAKSLRLPDGVTFVIATLSRSVPLSLRTMREVAVAQKARGLKLGMRNAVQPETYMVLLVPYVVSILRASLTIWVASNLRRMPTNLSCLHTRTKCTTLVEALILGGIGALWTVFLL